MATYLVYWVVRDDWGQSCVEVEADSADAARNKVADHFIGRLEVPLELMESNPAPPALIDIHAEVEYVELKP